MTTQHTSTGEGPCHGLDKLNNKLCGGPGSLIPVHAPSLRLDVTDPRAGPTLRREPEPRAFVSIEEVFPALSTPLQVVFNFLSANIFSASYS